MSTSHRATRKNIQPVIAAGTLLGIGMGGFVDGLLFHQIFQLHSMLSAKVPRVNLVNVEVNMVWDGLFHAFTWITTAIGIAMLWKAVQNSEAPRSTQMFVGSLLQGWGTFNLVEGIIDHHLLGLHHVVERLGVSVYDYMFLLFGGILIVGGQFLVRRASRPYFK